MPMLHRQRLVATAFILIATSTVPSEAREGFFGASRHQIAGSIAGGNAGNPATASQALPNHLQPAA